MASASYNTRHKKDSETYHLSIAQTLNMLKVQKILSVLFFWQLNVREIKLVYLLILSCILHEMKKIRLIPPTDFPSECPFPAKPGCVFALMQHVLLLPCPGLNCRLW